MLMIRPATTADQPEILRVFACAKTFMKKSGNLKQWAGEYPGTLEIEQDLAAAALYVVLADEVEQDGADSNVIKSGGVESEEKAPEAGSLSIVGTFAFLRGEEPTYRRIDDGCWRFPDVEYGTIHRLASDGRSKGIAQACFTFCQTLTDYLRIDTHEDNKKMQDCILHFGFVYCGKIICGDGTERLAYDFLSPFAR